MQGQSEGSTICPGTALMEEEERTWTPRACRMWIVFRGPDGEELAAITAAETNAAEIAQTVGLLAYENGLLPTEIEMKMEARENENGLVEETQ